LTDLIRDYSLEHNKTDPIHLIKASGIIKPSHSAIALVVGQRSAIGYPPSDFIETNGHSPR
jgi:hypothetical protein